MAQATGIVHKCFTQQAGRARGSAHEVDDIQALVGSESPCQSIRVASFGLQTDNSVMNTTSASLLIRLRDPSDREAWSRFVRVYGPMILGWARRTGLSDDDATDLVQDVMTLLVRKLPQFQYDRSKSFRGWLKTVTMNKWREGCRRKSLPIVASTDSEIGRVPDPVAEAFWESEYRSEVIARAMKLMEADFQPKTWEACRRYVLLGESPDDLATELEISVWTIYSAKSRLIKRLREEFEELLD